MENLTENNRLVMYVIAKEKYLATLLRERKITQSDFEKIKTIEAKVKELSRLDL